MNRRSPLVFGMAILLAGACQKASLENGSGGGSSSSSGGGKGGGSSMLNPGGPTDTVVVGDVAEQAVACDVPDKCPDFSVDPIFDDGTPKSAADSFKGDASGAGPCVVEPEDGTLIPFNWLRPRISWQGSGTFQITLSTPKEKDKLVAYTTKNAWAVPKKIWQDLTSHLRDEDVTVTVRSSSGGATTTTFRIAPASAAGSIVFWAARPDNVGNQNLAAMTDEDSYLAGFKVGEEGWVTALKMSVVKQPSRKDDGHTARKPQCIGCHAATPDSGYVGFVDHWPWNSVIANVTADNMGAELPNLSDGGLADLNKPWAGMPAFSKAFWKDGNRLMVTTSAQQSDDAPWSTDHFKPANLVYYNLDSAAPTQVNGQTFARAGQQYSVIPRKGDPHNGAAFPSWSHDGNTIVYCATDTTGCDANNDAKCVIEGNVDGRLFKGPTDLYTVPFNSGTGGDATPVKGAAESNWEEYYPAFSPDDAFVAFDRVPSGEVMYANPNAEVFLVPAKGGEPHYLRANKPSACLSGKSTPGINNHFPKWSPKVTTGANGKRYYWVIFSSNRADIPPGHSNYNNNKPIPISQLYVAGVVVEGDKITSYPAIYLWNQDTKTVNTTPVWESLDIPQVIL